MAPIRVEWSPRYTPYDRDGWSTWSVPSRQTTATDVTDAGHPLDDDHCSPPPPYSRYDTASTRADTASTRTATAPTIGSSISDPKVERLRRFLSFCIAVDYGAHLLSPDTLDKATWCHFMSLFLLSHELLIGYRPPLRRSLASTKWPRAISHPQLEKHIYQPAQKLGLSKGLVMSMLRNFAQQSHVGGYYSNLSVYPHWWDLGGLESKLRADRERVFDRVLPPGNEDLRTAIEKRHEQVTKKWFVILNPSYAVPTRKGNRKLAQEQYRDLCARRPSAIRPEEPQPVDTRLTMKALNTVVSRRNLYLRLLQHPGKEVQTLSR